MPRLYPKPGVMLALSAMLASCVIRSPQPNLEDQDLRLTILHTADIHSRPLKYRFTPGATDQGLGLNRTDAGIDGDTEYTVGGADRLAYLIHRERELSARVIHVDSGDGYQGAPIFNIWKGEAEIRVLSELGVNAAVIGNHEFDNGAQPYAENLEAYADFPALAANYLFDDHTQPWNNTMNRVCQPWTVINARGLRIGVVGMGNLDSLNSITEQGNSLGVRPLESVYAARVAVEQVRPLSDLVVLVTHMGPDEDAHIAQHVRHIDVIMGGHLHVALNPPMVVRDPDDRDVVIAHSSAFAKFLGRLDLVLRKPADPERAAEYGFEVVSHKFKLFPVDNRWDRAIRRPARVGYEIPATAAAARMQRILEDYQHDMAVILDFDRTVGCIGATRLPRFGAAGGDSAFGNIVAEAMQNHVLVQADFALTNAGGIRDDLRGLRYEEINPRACFDEEGDLIHSIRLEELFNVIPFDNTITTMFLTGTEVQGLFDYVAARSAQRGCRSQAHISGAEVTLVCHGDDEHGDYPHADDILIGGRPINSNGSYELAANSYIANGGSGFEVLQRNTTQVDTFISQRDAVIEYLGRVGVVPCKDGDAELPDCRGAFTEVGVEDGRITMRF